LSTGLARRCRFSTVSPMIINKWSESLFGGALLKFTIPRLGTVLLQIVSRFNLKNLELTANTSLIFVF